MMRRAVAVPVVDKLARPEAETIAAVGVADFHDRAGHGFPLGHQQFQPAIRGFHHREQRHRPVFDGHLHGESPADFAVIDLQRPHLGFALGDGDVARGRRAPSAPRRP